MGDPWQDGYPGDGEEYLHEVTVSPYLMAPATVTNERFAEFVAATGYRTTAETAGSSAVFEGLLYPGARQAVVGRVAEAPWWLDVLGANWRCPGGPGSSWKSMPDHPVVHVSWFDAVAYCRWEGSRLPTEAEWECAARGGLVGCRFPWGDELAEEEGYRCNIWRGQFPDVNTADDGWPGTAPAVSFAPNGYGLYQAVGNVWEWCADWFHPRAYRFSAREDPAGPAHGTSRVTRGGSHLCHVSYCYRYRVAARSSNTPDSSASNCGFRTVKIR